MTETQATGAAMRAGSGAPATMQRRPLGVLLLEQGLVTPDQLEDALAVRGTADGRRERLGQTLVRLGMVTEKDVARALAGQLGLEFVDVRVLELDHGVVAMIPPALARRHMAVPLRREDDGTLVIASADPTDIVARDDIRLAAGVRRIRAVVVPASVVRAAVRSAYGSERGTGELLEAAEADAEPEEEEDQKVLVEDAPIVRLVDGLLADALDAGASDVHVEPGPDGVAVRFRVDGVLRTVSHVPRNLRGKFISRLKLMGGMDIAERRLPQDGRAELNAKGAEVDLRMSTLPSLHGETVVLRLLRKGGERVTLDDVGFAPDQRALFESAIERPQGLILITGPTGSGKTSTLYAALGSLVDEVSNIITLEDPVEYELEGINQTQINERIGRTFARCLRTILRQDPDIVMVGEIRDAETAELAMQASLTGHLVFSTLHTNDAPGAVVRLRDLGIAPYLISSSLTMVLAQRLVRRVCESCAVPYEPTERQITQLHIAPQDVERAKFRVGGGCLECGFTGYSGRVGLFELLNVDSRMRELLTGSATNAALRHAARLSGMKSLREDGIDKAARGLTTLEELLRVIPLEADDEGICPVCAHVVEPDFGWCPACGTELGYGTCSGCERPLERGWNACPYCGTHTPGRFDDQGKRLPRVLVVDDDPAVLSSVEAMLVGEYQVNAAGDARTALQMAHRQPPDVAIIDVSMPGMDGFALTKELRARPATMHVPIVLMTAHDTGELELEGLRVGADAYVMKPFEPERLVARLDELVKRHA